MVERYGGAVSDSYQLALQAARNPHKKVIVESAVHFMAESIAILAHDDRRCGSPIPKAGCTMEMLAKDYVVEPVAEQADRALRRAPAGDRLHERRWTDQGARRPHRRRRVHQLERTQDHEDRTPSGPRSPARAQPAPGPQHSHEVGHGSGEVVALPDPQIGRGGFKVDDKTVAGRWPRSTRPR